jgi:hypothetical protein
MSGNSLFHSETLDLFYDFIQNMDMETFWNSSIVYDEKAAYRIAIIESGLNFFFQNLKKNTDPSNK